MKLIVRGASREKGPKRSAEDEESGGARATPREEQWELSSGRREILTERDIPDNIAATNCKVRPRSPSN